MIIDTHTHFYDPTRPQGVPWPPADDTLLYRTVLPHHYKALAEPLGIAGTVVVEASSWPEDNQWILDLAATEPFILGLVGHVEPNRDEFEAELAHFAANPLFHGIRCGGTYFEDVEKGRFIADMECLAAQALSLDVLVREPHLAGVQHLARRVPHLRIVVDHIAHMPIDGKPPPARWEDHYRRLADHPQLYIKVSGVMEQSTIQLAPTHLDFYRPALDLLWTTFGEDRLIYGSNWPVCERAGTLADSLRILRTYVAEKGTTATENFFWRNAQAVYCWPDHQSPSSPSI